MNSYFEIAVVSIMLLLVTGQEAQAYIDPGSGSIIMTAILGFIAAIGYTGRKYLYKLKNLFKKKNTEDPGNGPESNKELPSPPYE